MLLLNDPSDAPAGKKVVAVGSFDGLHLGHQHLLHQALHTAKSVGIPLLVYTFDPPTKVFIKGEGFLTDMAEKVELLRGLGIEIALIVPFNETFAQRSKGEFLQDLVALESHHLFVGEDFRFGQGRSGQLSDLQAVAPTQVLPLLDLGGEPVKSSRIRDLLKGGQVEEAKLLLGRPYAARGIVVEGDKLGRTLGYPTANLQTSPGKILPPGVYAVQTHSALGHYGGVANVGYRPTVSGKELRFEVHLFGFMGQLYGEELRVEFLKHLRSEQRFDGLAALKAQLDRDATAARQHLGL